MWLNKCYLCVPPFHQAGYDRCEGSDGCARSEGGSHRIPTLTATGIRSYSSSCSSRSSFSFQCKWISAFGLVDCMTFYMLAQMVTAHETFVTYGTSKSFLSSVSTKVACQLIRTSKSFSAAFPAAWVGTFSSVCPDVSFQMRTLSVCFATCLPWTDVCPFLGFSRSTSWSGLWRETLCTRNGTHGARERTVRLREAL